MSTQIFLTYLIALAAIVVIPGPTVALVVGNTLAHGRRAGLLTVAGTQLGLAVLIVVVAFGLASIVAAAGWWFDVLRTIGAAYLIWLGLGLLRSSGRPTSRNNIATVEGRFGLQGFLLALSNPKTSLFLGAFMPQFISPGGDYFAQIAILGVTAMLVGAISDVSYVLLSGGASALASERWITGMSKGAGAMLVAGGVYLAVARAK